jgi:hypothetical protein
MWAAPELLGVPTIGTGSAQSGGGGRGGLRSQISLPSRPKYMKTAKKRAVSRTYWLINLQNSVFAQKYLTRYTHETLFEKYVNFQNHYLSHCGVIPDQSFRSHIRPRPHGLGLRCPSMKFSMAFFFASKEPIWSPDS